MTDIRQKLREYNWSSDRDYQLAVIAFRDLITSQKAIAGDRGHSVGFKNGKWAVTSHLKNWVEKHARVMNVQGIDKIKDGQYIRVDDLLDRIAQLSTEDVKESFTSNIKQDIADAIDEL